MTALIVLALGTPVIGLLLLLGMAWTEQLLDRSDLPELLASDVAPVAPLLEAR